MLEAKKIECVGNRREKVIEQKHKIQNWVELGEYTLHIKYTIAT
jgi:hypothetical protein